MEAVIPQNIIIGPFFVNADIVRLALGRKHKDIAQALLKYLVDSLRKDTEQVHFSKGEGANLMGSNDISQGFSYWGVQGGSFPPKPSIFPPKVIHEKYLVIHEKYLVTSSHSCYIISFGVFSPSNTE